MLRLPARVVWSRLVGKERGAEDGWQMKYETGLAFTLPAAQAAVVTQLLARLTRETEAGIVPGVCGVPAVEAPPAPEAPPKAEGPPREGAA
jgi:hypothetical protein